MAKSHQFLSHNLDLSRSSDSSSSLTIGLICSIKTPIRRRFLMKQKYWENLGCCVNEESSVSYFLLELLWFDAAKNQLLPFQYYWHITVFKIMFPITIGLIHSIEVPEKKSFFFKRKKSEFVGKEFGAAWMKIHRSCSCCWNHWGSKQLTFASLPSILTYFDFQYQVPPFLLPR